MVWLLVAGIVRAVDSFVSVSRVMMLRRGGGRIEWRPDRSEMVVFQSLESSAILLHQVHRGFAARLGLILTAFRGHFASQLQPCDRVFWVTGII